MSSLLVKVKSRLFLRSGRAAFHQLDGQFRSVAKGRGSDFDDLREYSPGDDVRDIDWNATARSNATLVRRFHPERRHVVTFLVDTGPTLAAVTREGAAKSDVTLAAVGTLAYLTTRHGDDVGLLCGAAGHVKRLPARQSDVHLEHVLRAIHHAAATSAADTSDPTGGIERVLDTATRVLRQRMTLVCVTDEITVSADIVEKLRRLRARHDLIWLTVGDDELAWRGRPRGTAVVDVGDSWLLPAFVHAKRRVREEAVRSRNANRAHTADALQRLGIPHAVFHSADAVVPALITLLSTRGHARG